MACMRISDFGYPIVPSQSKRKEELLGEFLLRARRRSGVNLCVWVSWCERRNLNSRFVCVWVPWCGRPNLDHRPSFVSWFCICVTLSIGFLVDRSMARVPPLTAHHSLYVCRTRIWGPQTQVDHESDAVIGPGSACEMCDRRSSLSICHHVCLGL